MRSHVAVAIALIAVLALATGATTQLSMATDIQDSEDDANDPQQGVFIEIELQSNGDARWTVTNQFAIDPEDENETAAFERLAADFQRGNADTGYSVKLFQQTADRASGETGRPMQIQAVNRTSELQNETGNLTLSFTWTNFAQETEEQLILGDVFVIDSRTWLPVLSENQQLIIKPPEGYAVQSTPRGIGVDDGIVEVKGPRNFEPGELTVEYVERDVQGPNTNSNQLITTLFPLLGVLGGGAAVVWLWRRNNTLQLGGSTDEPQSADVSTASTNGTVAGDDGLDEQLLSDEERIKRLLVENDARMMQADIVSETNWSNAKVSQLLSSMADDDQIQKLRIGRENLIALPDEDITDVK